MALEALLSPASFTQDQRLSPAGRLVEQFEAQEFADAHGVRACECGTYCAQPDARAVTFDGNRAVCRRCRTARQVDRSIASQQLQVQHMRRGDVDRRIARQQVQAQQMRRAALRA